MLVLSRQRDESIMIGDNVQITVVDIRGDKVRLGIVAPGEIPVHRKEVYDAIQRENRKAAGLATTDLAAAPAQAVPPGSNGPAAGPLAAAGPAGQNHKQAGQPASPTPRQRSGSA